MTKQEKIRNALIDFLDGLETPYTDEDDRPRGHIDELLEKLNTEGLVFKVYRELPKALYYEEEHLDPKWVEEAVKSDMLKWHNDSFESLVKNETK